MSLVVVTGGARSGKSGVGMRLALAREKDVVLVAAGSGCDQEMRRRIEAHRRDRGADIVVVEPEHPAAWVPAQPEDSVVLLDCLGSLVAGIVIDALGVSSEVTEDAERQAARMAEDLVAALLAREGDTVVVTNEVGDGVVPAFASGRLFRDVLGRANRALVDGADAAWLVVAGRCVELTALPRDVRWPDGDMGSPTDEEMV